MKVIEVQGLEPTEHQRNGPGQVWRCVVKIERSPSVTASLAVLMAGPGGDPVTDVLVRDAVGEIPISELSNPRDKGAFCGPGLAFSTCYGEVVIGTRPSWNVLRGFTLLP